MDVEQHDVGLGGHDRFDGGGDVVGFTDDGDVSVELGAHPGAHEGVVVDDQHADLTGRGGCGLGGVGHSGIRIWTSVPAPGFERMVVVPPARAILPMMESRTPPRSVGRASGSNPHPRSRTNTATSSGEMRANTWIGWGSPECRAALSMASRAAATTASVAGVWVVRSPTVTTSMRAASRLLDAGGGVLQLVGQPRGLPGVGLLGVEPGA